MNEENPQTCFDEEMTNVQTSLDNLFRKVRDDAFHAGFQAGTQQGVRAILPAAARSMRESADMWPDFPKELVLNFADLMEHAMTVHFVNMIPNAAERDSDNEQKQA